MSIGTGTRATGGAAVAANELITAARMALNDETAATWRDEELLAYLREAVAEYSVHLPRTAEVVINTVPLVMSYGLPADTTAVVEALCIKPDQAPRVMHCVPRKTNRYNQRMLVYAIQPSNDATAPPRLTLTFFPTDGMQLALRVKRPHAAPAGPDDILTVPAAHHHVLVAYILFAASRRLQAAEQAAPTSSSSLLMSQLAANTRRLELGYLNALNRVLTHRLGEGEVVAWG